MPGSFTIAPETWLLNPPFKDAVSVHLRQGVPLLDRDLNLMGDLAAEQARRALATFFGDGALSPVESVPLVPRDALPSLGDFQFLDLSAFQIAPITNGAGALIDILIRAGSYLVAGVVYTNPKDVTYQALSGSAIPPFSGTGTIFDTVYLDAWVAESDLVDTSLDNREDIGERTSVRDRPRWTVGVVRGRTASLPPPAPGHNRVILAEIQREPSSFDISDQRIPLVTLGALERWIAALEKALQPAFHLSPSSPPLVPGRSASSAASGVELVVEGANLEWGNPRWTLDGEALRRRGSDVDGSAGTFGFDDGGRRRVLPNPPVSQGSVTLAVDNGFGRAETTLIVVPREPRSAPEWIAVPDATGIDIGVLGHDAWLIGTKNLPGGREISRWTGERFEPLPGGVDAARIAAAPGGTAWVVTSRNTLLRYEDGIWAPVRGAATDIAAGVDGTVYKIGTRRVPGGYEIARLTDGAWEVIDGGAERIAVDGFGNPAIVDDRGRVFVRRYDRWILRSGKSLIVLRAYDIGALVYGAVVVTADVREPRTDTPVTRGLLVFNGELADPVIMDAQFSPQEISADAAGVFFSITSKGEVIRYATRQ